MNDLPPKLSSLALEDAEESGQEKEQPLAAPDEDSVKLYRQVLKSIEDMAVHLKPLLENASDEESTSSSSEDCVMAAGEETPDHTNSEDKPLKSSCSDCQDAASTENFENNKNLNKTSSGSSNTRKTSHLTWNKRNAKTNSINHKIGSSAHSPSHNESQQRCVLSRPMQRKLFSLLQCQLLEEEGQARSARIARALGERVVTELLVLQQFPHQLSSNLWAAVRTRGCQFLGPAMQEEVLKLILLALEDGSPLSRKVLVLFVVQKLEVRYSQASKTAIGHVVQLLYRASCFKVQKRDGESSLMQLKEEFRQYEALRREHDSQIVQIALEAGLRISPEQWSSLLYGDVAHKPHMQSIIDKHQSPQSFSQNITELMGILQKNPDGNSLLRLKPHLEFLSNIDPSPDSPVISWENLGAVMRSVNTIIGVFVDYLSHHGVDHSVGGGSKSSVSCGVQDSSLAQKARYKTSMCRDFSSKGTCPRGTTCTFAHTQEEMEKYRLRSRKNGIRGRLPTQEKTTSSLTESESHQLRQVQMLSKLKVASLPGANETGEYVSLPSQSQSPVRNSPSQITALSGNQSFSSGMGAVKFNQGEAENRPRVNMPTTRLTFSRPALDGPEPSSSSATNQQASLHPNNPHVRQFYPKQNVAVAPPVLPTQVPGFPPCLGPPAGSYSVPPPDTGGGLGNLGQQHMQQQQQEFSLAAPHGSVASLSSNPHAFLPGVDPRLSYSGGDFGSHPGIRQHEDDQINQVVLDQMLDHQHRHHQQQIPIPVTPYPVQAFYPPEPGDATLNTQPGFPAPLLVPMPVIVVDYFTPQQPPLALPASPQPLGGQPQQRPRGSSTTLGDLWQRKKDIIQHLRDDPTFLDWQDPSLYQADSLRAGFHGLNTVLSLNQRTRQPMPKPVTDMFVATRSTQSLDKLVYEESLPASWQNSRVRKSTESNFDAPQHSHVMHHFGHEQVSSSLVPSSQVNAYTSSTSQSWHKAPMSWHTATDDVNANSVIYKNSGDGLCNPHLGPASSSGSSNYSIPHNSRTMLGSYSPSSSDSYQAHQMTVYNSLSSGTDVLPLNSSAADSEFS
ncbi:roquin-2, partial [Elysia marginata]